MSWQEQRERERGGALVGSGGERYRLGTAVGIRFPAVDSAAGFGVVTRCLCAVLGDEYQEEEGEG